MEPWLDIGVWERVARELRQHRQAGFGAILTEDVLRFSAGRALGAAGCEPTSLAVERPHPAIAGSRIDLVVGEPARVVIEFKYPREPIEKNAAWTMVLGEVLKDFYRLAVYPGNVDRLFVLASSTRLRAFLRSSADRYGMDVDRDHVELGSTAAAALPRTAANVIGPVLSEHHVTASRSHSIDVDHELHLGVYLVAPIAASRNPMVTLAAAPRDEESLSRPVAAVASDPSPPTDSGPRKWAWDTDRKTIWDELAECVTQLDEPFRRSEIIGWFRRHHPSRNEASLAAHIQGATSNGGHATGQFASRRPLLTRIDHGVYRRYEEA